MLIVHAIWEPVGPNWIEPVLTVLSVERSVGAGISKSTFSSSESMAIWRVASLAVGSIVGSGSGTTRMRGRWLSRPSPIVFGIIFSSIGSMVMRGGF